MSILETNRPWSNEIKEKIKTAGEKELLEYFNEISKKWTVSKGGNIVDDACKKLNIKSLDGIDTSELQLECQKVIYEITQVYSKFNVVIEDHKDYALEWARIYEVVYYCEKIIRDGYLLHRTNDEKHNAFYNEDTDILFKFSRFSRIRTKS